MFERMKELKGRWREGKNNYCKTTDGMFDIQRSASLYPFTTIPKASCS